MLKDHSRTIAALLVSTLTACGGSTVPLVDASVTDAPVADAPVADTGSPISCSGVRPVSFPTFARNCAAASDCVVVNHQTDCCGNSRAMGIRASERAAFDAAEAICRPMYPGCGCPASAPVTDDGATSPFGAMIAVSCSAGVCTSHAM